MTDHHPLSHRHLIVVGAGYLGQKVAAHAATSKRYDQVIALRRSPIQLPGVKTLSLDWTKHEDHLFLRDFLKSALNPPIDDRREKIDVLYCLSPLSSTPDSYQSVYKSGLIDLVHTLQHIGNQHQIHIILASSTSVYQENNGGYVDEMSTEQNPPIQFPGSIIYEGEELIRNSGFDWTILRYGGLYGPRRTSLISRVHAGQEYLFDGPPFYTNRIHIEDAASMALFCFQHDFCKGQIFNAVDCAPAPRNEVIKFLWEQAPNTSPPLKTTSDPRDIRHRGNKRCLSTKIQALGFVFEYPTYKEGYG